MNSQYTQYSITLAKDAAKTAPPNKEETTRERAAQKHNQYLQGTGYQEFVSSNYRCCFSYRLILMHKAHPEGGHSPPWPASRSWQSLLIWQLLSNSQDSQMVTIAPGWPEEPWNEIEKQTNHKILWEQEEAQHVKKFPLLTRCHCSEIVTSVSFASSCLILLPVHNSSYKQEEISFPKKLKSLQRQIKLVKKGDLLPGPAMKEQGSRF